MFDVEIITPERRVFQGRAASLVAPGVGGLFGVLDHHAPLLNALQTGVVAMKGVGSGEGGGVQLFSVGGGFLEVAGNKVVLLADSAEDQKLINVERARKARERAEGRLRDKGNPLIDQVRAEAALKRALNRLRAANLT